ncbi:MAG TPA: TldD/PmbA family protein, partial [Bacteroidia bacterium]|nr:TldD/PmbA family protein [Bacteroidia bacterium]
MQRRDWLKGTSAAGLGLLASRWLPAAESAATLSDRFPTLADAVLGRAAQLGASFSDLHLMQLEDESLYVREEMVQGVHASASLGASVRVLVDGAWGFAAAGEIDEGRLLALVDSAVAVAKGQAGWRLRPVEIETLPAHRGRWEMPVEADPFAIPLEEKVDRLLAINRTALGKGATYCHSHVSAVRERKWLANSFGTRVEQTRTRIHPAFGVTLVDRKSGRFATRDSMRPPRAAGWEHLSGWDAAGEAALAVEQARKKMAAPPVKPGTYDLVIAPSNLWLTIHETVG